MNLSQLYYFRKLAELEHYGKASEELFITQPSLSNSIGNLEKELGVPLFERVGRNVRLTSYGAEFNEHVCVALSEIDKAVDLMKLYSSGLSGQIRIGTVISIQRNFLPLLLSSFRKEFGDNIDFDIYQGTTYDCLKGLLDGKLDVAFCGMVPDERDIVYEPMITQNLVVGVSEHHELAKRESVTLEELKNYDTVSYRKESFASTILEGLFRRVDLTPKQSFNDEISAAALVVSETDTVAIMLETLDDIEMRGFVSVSISDTQKPFHTIYMAYKEKAFRSCVTDQLVEFARKFAMFPSGKIGTLEDFYHREQISCEGFQRKR